MESYLKIQDLGQLVKREWTNEKGVKKTIASIEVLLTNGLDTLVAEATDELAYELEKCCNEKTLDTTALYRVRMSLNVRKSKDKGIMFNTIRILQMQMI